MIHIIRSAENPVLLPDSSHAWEDMAAFNGSPVHEKRSVHLFYRALGHPEYHDGAFLPLSIIGHTRSSDGIHFGRHTPFITPEEPWERYGCEDPRVTKLGDTFYIFYTALSTFPFSPEGITVGLATTKDLKTIDAKHHITPFNSKAMTLFPEKINGKFAALLSVDTDQPPTHIALALFENESDMWSENYWNEWYADVENHTLDLHKLPGDHIEIGSSPLLTKHGWLLIYSHIYNYGTSEQVFGIEAVLLDIENPRHIIGQTKSPMLVPQEEYERYGMIPNIIFPSGAYIDDDDLHIYYGAADTTICRATVSLNDILDDLLAPPSSLRFERSPENPILSPISEHAWEDKMVFNPAALLEEDGVHLIYRAMGHEDTSVFGYAKLDTESGTKVIERFSEPIYIPRADFEQKYHPGNSGCEDPRITRIGNTYYLCYTAFDGINPPRIALSSISAKDFLERHFEQFSDPILISSPHVDDKDAALFPEKIRGHYVIIHRLQPSIDLNYVSDLSVFDGKNFLTRNPILQPRIGMWDDLKIGLSSTPLKTDHGWLMLYHGVSSADNAYRVGAALLDLKHPEKVIGRTDTPLFEPEMPYEKEGVIPNVVFPCGSVIKDGRIIIYYGGADTVIGVASVSLQAVLDELLDH